MVQLLSLMMFNVERKMMEKLLRERYVKVHL